MGRVVLHLLGSLVLGIVLLGMAELLGRSEVHAGSRASAVVRQETSPVTVPTATAARQTLYERCWELVGVRRPVSESNQPQVTSVRERLSFGWEYLPPHLVAR